MTDERPKPDDVFAALHLELVPRADALREGVKRLAATPDAAKDVREDADRLGLAAEALHKTITHLPGMADGSDPAARARVVRHDLLNSINHIFGYTQGLLQDFAPEDLPPGWPDELKAALEIGREIERAVQGRLTPTAAPARVNVSAEPKNFSPVTPGVLLVVDDDADNRATLTRALRAQGHKVEEAADGSAAMEVLARSPIDLVLLDISMPVMDGYEVLRRIREDARRNHLPVMMISGLDERAHIVHCIQAGAEDFLPKPVDFVLLRARVNSLLHRRQLRVRELEQFFPAEVARLLIDRPELLEKGYETDISVLFCDIRNYSKISRRLGPAATIRWVSSVMEALTSTVLDEGGMVVDFAGDELFAMWGAPTAQPDHAAMACETGLKLLKLREKLNQEWSAKIEAEIAFGVGINSGQAWVGNSGTRRKFKYGPSGNTVNLGSRVQGATKYMKAPLIITKETLDRVGDRFATRRLGTVRVVNIDDPVHLYEVAPQGVAGWDEAKREHERALELYERRELDAAARLLGAQVALQGAAGPPLALLARTIQGILEPDRWQAVFELPGK